MGKKGVSFIAALLFSVFCLAQDKMTPQEYIQKYKDYAIIEMHRAGVPASITLSQGLLESSNGNSRLAKEAMNHFGIKCKSTWKGGVIYADDDAPNECFRAYESVLSSYKDHSDFLRNNWRYHPLFELELTDYKGWAKGLRKAGYATNPKYHTILINIIERYELFSYDLLPLPDKKDQLIVTHNDIPAVYAPKDASAESIAKEHDLRAKHIYRYNDLKPGDDINEGDLIYLKPKRRKGSSQNHTVRQGESMYLISQRYGIKLKHLYKKNRMEPGTEPKEGEKLELRSKRSKADSVDIKDDQELATEEIIQDNFVNPHIIKIEKADPIKDTLSDRPEYYIVVPGDNIYRIAERFHILEEDLLRWNGLESLQLKVGQKLYLSEQAAKSAGPRKVIVNDPEPEIVIEKVEKKIETPKQEPLYHLVQPGETVYRICVKYKITQEQLMKWNNLSKVTIYSGQKLRVSQ